MNSIFFHQIFKLIPESLVKENDLSRFMNVSYLLYEFNSSTREMRIHNEAINWLLFRPF